MSVLRSLDSLVSLEEPTAISPAARWLFAFLREGSELFGSETPERELGFAVTWASGPLGSELGTRSGICLAWEASYSDAVAWGRAGGEEYWPVREWSPVSVVHRLRSWRDSRALPKERRLPVANSDFLTGLPLLGSLERDLEAALRRASKEERPLACLFLDLDRFKDLNERRGHLEGNRLLQRTAFVLRQALRSEDRLYRYGGDEFVVLLESEGEEIACQVGERLRQAVRNDAELRAEGLTLSVGVGVQEGWDCLSAPVLTEGLRLELLEQADSALRKAKRLSRDRVESSNLEAVSR